MNHHPLRPRPGSLRTRIEAFYLANPHEYLTWEDVCIKFDCTKDQAVTAINALRDEGRMNLEAISVVRVKAAPKEDDHS